MRFQLLVAVVALALGTRIADAASVLMVSVDGLRPDYVTRADEKGARIPFLRSLIANGSYAEGVKGVWPTNTYPSHTTLLTGTAPAVHGIYNNLEFDPSHTFADAWFWYAAQIQMPTLWQIAHRAGLVTASVGWPVSVGATDVDYLIPEYWRIFHATADLNPSDRYLIAALSRPEGMLSDMQRSLGPYLMGNDTSVEADETKTRFSLDILARHGPGLMTVHLSSLDEQEHAHGPFSSEAIVDLEAIDGMLSRLAAAARLNDATAVTLVVSDHGFTALTHHVNLCVPFVNAGLIETRAGPENGSPTITRWAAEPWLASGMAAIMLHDPRDEAMRGRVRELLHGLLADRGNGIAAVLETDEIRQKGAFPGASFLVVMQLGFATGSNLTGPMVTPFVGHGGHGFQPGYPDMNAAFFAVGAGIAHHRDLGVIDMLEIAPTVASLLGIEMPTASRAPLRVRQ